ncbi:Plasma membrane proteolipid 31 [Cytospora mali]|uniref:Plasma membrane proteolipid 31 n=1 Tax=Cytospora mali TaxID=578113 RepID=A0A194V0N6_CYTMA|nr:Plasma membrane proteolipid 31 [Valsa mali var. pyri (nom. inval.)]
MCTSDLFLGLLALLFPPLPVWVKCGICSADSLLNILLCMLGYVPGLLHAWYIIAKYPEPVEYYGNTDSEGGRVRYIIVNQGDEEAGGSHGGREGSSEDLPPPPSYAQVMGDHKIQDRN